MPAGPRFDAFRTHSADPKVQNANNAAVDTHTSVAHRRWRTYRRSVVGSKQHRALHANAPRLGDAGLPDGADRELVLRRRPSTSTSSPPAIRSSRRPPSGEFDANQLVQT